MHSRATQPYKYTYPFSPKLPSHPGCQITLSSVPCAIQYGYQSWVFFGRNDAKAETPVLWPPHAKSWPIGKDSDAGRDWRQEEKGTTEDEMAGWHHRLDGREFEWTPGVGDGQEGLACCNSWGHKKLDMTEQLNWTDDLNIKICAFSLLVKWVIPPPLHQVKTEQSCKTSSEINRWGKDRWRLELEDLKLFATGFPGGSDNKESACNAEDPSSTPGSRRSAGEGNGYPL